MRVSTAAISEPLTDCKIEADFNAFMMKNLTDFEKSRRKKNKKNDSEIIDVKKN